MKFEDIPGQLISVRVQSEKPLSGGEIIQLLATNAEIPQFDLRLANNDGRRRVSAVDELEGRMLASKLRQSKSFLARLAEPGTDGSFALQVMLFSSSPIDDVGELEIGIDDKGVRACRYIAKVPNLSPSEIYAGLKEKCVYTTQNGGSYFFVIQGHAVETDIDDKTSNQFGDVLNSDVPGGPSVNATVENSFSVRGANIRFVATKVDAGDREIYVASRINDNVSNPDVQIRMALGNLKFCNWTKAHALQSVTKARLTKIVNGDESYLKTWDKFGEIEGKLLLEKAREFGIIEYANARQDREDTVVVDIIGGKTDAKWESGVEVDWVDKDPEYLDKGDMTVEAFINGLVSDEVDDDGNIKRRRAKKKRTQYYEIVSVSKDHNGMTMRLKDSNKNLPKSGYFVWSLAGDKPVIARRNAARRRILEGRSANPQLGLLIEENAEVQLEPPNDTKALSSFVRQKIFKHDPTPKQEEAVKLALSTPDIALIQGPPGTGKTTVITAILERLNEMAGANGARGSVLLTGFQHDAVENMTRRMSINGLPVPKFGRRSGQSEEDRTDFERRMDDWCAKCASRIRRSNPEISEVEGEETLKGLCLQYINAPSKRMALSVLKAIRESCGKMIDTLFTSKVEALIKRFEHEEKLNSAESKVLDLVRNIRTSSAGFIDDGRERAMDAMFGIQGELGIDALDDHTRAVLQRAIDWDGDSESLIGITEDLKTAKVKMMIQFSTPPEFRAEKQNVQVVEIAKAAIKKIKQCGMKANDEKLAAVAEFLEALETSPIGMSKAVSDYSFAFAATCQQSVNAGMYELKCGGTGTASSDISYDYVIVDEAARVSPRDLMISLAQGKKIVLVGDHRQLPHIIDDDVAAQMADQETLKMSMFQYLFSNRLKSLYEKDKFNRSVTLDKQYRMHPVLGGFISKNFYERYAPDEHFDSGIVDCSYFAHNLPETDNCPALWINVRSGKAKKDGTSWQRESEAAEIAMWLGKWMFSPEGMKLDFGVISFYKAQADLIKEKLGAQDKRFKNELKSGRLRVGTVDSFQGMEFDVVFLSAVRTQSDTQAAMNDMSLREFSRKVLRDALEKVGDQRYEFDDAELIEDRLSRDADVWKEMVAYLGERVLGKQFSEYDFSTVKTFDVLLKVIEDIMARRSFGHLCAYNRLNVSMSRQKKLLAVVGDERLAAGDLAEKYIPGIVEFRKLCNRPGEGRFING